MGSSSTLDLWDFTLSVYGAEGVSAAVIGLQERCGADVNLLFLCCWCGATGRGPLGPETLAAADATVAAWREGVTQPLRAVRDAIKADQSLATMPDAMEMRRKVLAAEVDSERVAQLRLEALAPAPGTSVVDPLADAAASLSAYLDRLGAAPTAENGAALATLLQAAFAGTDGGSVKAALAAVRPG